MSWSYSLGMDAPNSLAKASNRRVRADNGSVGHGSWAKLVNKSGWVTWVMDQYKRQKAVVMGHGSIA